jgi:hypothetical protein
MIESVVADRSWSFLFFPLLITTSTDSLAFRQSLLQSLVQTSFSFNTLALKLCCRFA